MSILTPTHIYARVVWLGVVRDRAVTLESERVATMPLTWEGPEGECHGGLTRPACSRVKLQHPRGAEIRNTRQLTILSAEELADVAREMDLPEIAPEWTGANVIVTGVPEFTMIPPGSRLVFGNGATIAVDMENGPCRFVAEVIEGRHPGKGMAFPRIAAHRRGVTGWVERPGVIAPGDEARLHVPPQRIYAHAQRVRETA
jgi:MOSC domain-containing protein YiiM